MGLEIQRTSDPPLTGEVDTVPQGIHCRWYHGMNLDFSSVQSIPGDLMSEEDRKEKDASNVANF